MLYQPTNITPSMLGEFGEGVVDVSEQLTISWQVNGNTPMTAFSITIYNNDAESTQIFTTNKIFYNCPFSGYNQDGTITPFSYTLDKAAITFGGLTNGNEYKFIIQQWWGDDDVKQSVTQSSASVFQTRSTPTLSINNVPLTLQKYNHTFYGTYSQEQNVPIVASRWQICVNKNEDDPLEDTGMMYGVSNLQYYFDGFLNGYEYGVRLIVETADGVIVSTDWEYFNVVYAQDIMTNLATAQCLKSLSSVQINIPQIANIDAVASNDAKYVVNDNSLYLSSGSISWNQFNGEDMDLQGGWTMFWGGVLNNILTPTMLFSIGLANNCRLVCQYHTMDFPGYLDVWCIECSIYDEDNNVVAQGFVRLDDTYFLGSASWRFYIGVSSNGKIIIQFYKQTQYPLPDGRKFVVPSQSLYPTLADAENVLYPDGEDSWLFAEYRDMDFFGVRNYLSSFCGVSLYQNTTSQYVWVSKNVYNQSQIQDIINNTDPTLMSWQNPETFMFLNFSKGLFAGNTQHIINGYSIYRRDVANGTLTFVTNTGLTDTRVIDAAVKNNKNVEYYLFGIGTDTYTDILVTNAITLQDWSWTILECSLNDDKSYTVDNLYAFRANVTSGNVSNNGTVNVLYNFTRYPTIQTAPFNYQSGTLKALIGVVNDGVYSDTISLRDAINELSTTNKTLFLKNRKGDLLKIRINGNIVMTTDDNASNQALSMSLPWIEIGDTNDVRILIDNPNTVFTE